MKRRDVLKTASLTVAALSVPRFARAAAELSNPATSVPSGTAAWTTVDVTTRVRILSSDAPARVWLPVPLERSSYQELLATSFANAPAGAGLVRDPKYRAAAFYAVVGRDDSREFSVSHRVRVRDYVVPQADDDLERGLFLQPTAHVPTDGIVREKALRIVGAAADPFEKARRIYDWIIENTFRDGETRGCGVGDVRAMLTSGRLGGKCADINSLFVGLCRAAGVPARETFGVRVLASSKAPSLGKAGDVSKAQHCRAEFFVAARGGWIPADPADVRKVILEEKLDVHSPRVTALGKQLFGAWEMNWVAFNSARDFELPDFPGPVNYLMYPTVYAGGELNDGMEPPTVAYDIRANRIG